MLKKNFQRVGHWIWRKLRPSQVLPKEFTVGSPAVLSADIVWIQTFNTQPFEIDRISLLFATFQRQNVCTVDIRVFSNEHSLLHHETVRAESLTDNVAYALKLPEGFTYRGECYLSIASNDATPSNCVALWTESDLGGFGLRAFPRNDRDVSGIALATKGCAAYRGIALAIRVGRYNRTHTSRSYIQPGKDAAKPHLTSGIFGLFGFSAIELQVLSTFAESHQPKLESLSTTELDRISSYEALLISPLSDDLKLMQSIARLARREMVPLILVDVGEVSSISRSPDTWPAFADGLIARQPRPDSRLPQENLDKGLSCAVGELVTAWRNRHQPKVSIVTILSGKAEQLKWVIGTYFNQTYQGEIEVIYIDDCFGGDAESVVKAEFARNEARPHSSQLSYRILRNERNLGNCASRNRGVASASGDIIVIIDADCMLNRQFIAAHVQAHAYLDCEVVTGPHNIETRGAQPLEKLAELERTPMAALEESDLQDPVFLDGFLNCVTRNFSIKKSAVIEDLFDQDFSYSLAPDTGFGWEDVEMGYRLYKRALGIKFTEDAFSVHISHRSSVSEAEKPRKSIRNFRKLFIKHPELQNVARRWAVRTLGSLEEWSSRVDPSHKENSDLEALNRLFEEAPRAISLAIPRRRKLRVLTYRWHVPHQYELYKSGHDFFLVQGAGTSMCDQWEYGHRPRPMNATFIDLKDVQESNFDLALLHFDENVLNYENTNGQIGPEWGATFRHFVEHINLPKIAICHGTPQFRGQYTPGYDKPDLMEVIEPARAALVEYVKEISIVCNSHQAQREWGFYKSQVIWHGFDPSEFLPSSYQKGILSPLGPLVNSRPHYRGLYLYQQVFSSAFPSESLPETLKVPDPDIDYTDNVFAVAKYKNYIDQIRQYSIYFNPTLRSPMPRARCEPMMCGIVTVNANTHDVDMFIKNGVNGFYSNDPDELRDQLIYLLKHPNVTRRIGEEARKTAIDVFNHDRYLAEWSALFNSVV